MNQIEIVKEILDEMLEIGGIPTNEEFYTEFNFRLQSRLNIDNEIVNVLDTKIIKTLIKYNDYLFTFIDKDNVGVGTEDDDVIKWYSKNKQSFIKI